MLRLLSAEMPRNSLLLYTLPCGRYCPKIAVVIEPEQRTTIREYVVKERVAPATVKERISVGATLPADVELRTVPSTWGPKFSKYRYVYTVVQVVE
jgi:Protein of unknown function (DUF1236)